jgi:hypothetical protein
MNENDKGRENRELQNEMPDVTRNQVHIPPNESAADTDHEAASPPFMPESEVSMEPADTVAPLVADVGEAPKPLPHNHSDSSDRPIASNVLDSLEITRGVEDPVSASDAGDAGALDQVPGIASEGSFREEQGTIGNLHIESPAPLPWAAGQDEPTQPGEASFFGGMIKYVTDDRTSDLNPRTKRMLRPTSDGGRPLARPVVEVRLSDEQLQRLQSRERLEAARKNEQTCRELVQEEIRKEFWRRDCQDRAIWGR